MRALPNIGDVMQLQAIREREKWKGDNAEDEKYVYLEVVCREYDEEEGLMACDILTCSDEAREDEFAPGQVVHIYFDEGTEKWSIWEEDDDEAWQQ